MEITGVEAKVRIDLLVHNTIKTNENQLFTRVSVSTVGFYVCVPKPISLCYVEQSLHN